MDKINGSGKILYRKKKTFYINKNVYLAVFLEVCFLLALIVFPEIFYYEIFDDSVFTGKWVQQSFRLSICVVLKIIIIIVNQI